MVTQQVSAVAKSVFHVLVDTTAMDLACLHPLASVMLVSFVDLGHLCLHQLMALRGIFVQEEDTVLKDQQFKLIVLWVLTEIPPEIEQKKTVLNVIQGKTFVIIKDASLD